MKLNKLSSSIFVPDNTPVEKALERTTHLCIAAHQDDIELMCYQGISECFGINDKWFCGVVVADGAGSPRTGIYGDFSDEQMKAVRITEQNKAAFVGEYGAQLQLSYSSKEIKDSNNTEIVDELARIIIACRPKVIYTHNLADKHDTHIGVVTKVIKAVRKLAKKERPEKFYGCEVWRDLDWVVDGEKVVFDVSDRPNIAASLVGVFDSQICGGKRYDLAALGRRTANATYSASHGCDNSTGLSYGLDYSPMLADDKLSPQDFIAKYIENFKADVLNKLNKID